MKRRATTGGKAIGRRSKTPSPKRKTAATVTRHGRASDTDLQEKFVQQTRELAEAQKLLAEALEQQTATNEVLKVISSSSADLEPVLRTILKNATQICAAKFGTLFLREKEGFRSVALHNVPPAFAEERRRNPIIHPGPANNIRRAVETREIVHVADIAADKEATVAIKKLGGARTVLNVPMVEDNTAIGVISIFRQEVRPFTDRQIELMQNFAAQAVIAIENARLLNELRQRTDDLGEALEQQTATTEVLKVISSSPGQLKPVFNVMLENAVKLCGAKFGNMLLYDGTLFHNAAFYNAPQPLLEFLQQRGPFRPLPGTSLDRVIQTKAAAHIADDAARANASALTRLAGARTNFAVPMLKDDALIGAITIYRQEVRPFTDKQIALVQNFANQAVIAIENARLLSELRERTEQLQAQSQEVVKLNQQLEGRVAEQVGEIERMGRLRRFLPPQVADLIVSQGAEKQLESHRREITALFCDLRGFTGFSESSDPEDVMALLREYHAVIGKIVVKYNGTLERFAGDGVMVIFNDPVPVPNPALQAVLMALEMRASLGALIDQWQQLGHDLGFGMGISHGYATLGTIGFEGRFDYAAIGTVSNVASRLCDEAKPGQILISPRVAQAVKAEIAVEPVGELTLKGIRRPLLVHNVVGAANAS